MTRRLRICQIIPTLVQGGAEKQMSLLASHLDPSRFESHVVVLTHSGPYEEYLHSRGVHVHIVGKRGKLDPTALQRLTATLRKIAPDVVHTWLFAANSYGRFAAHRAKVPVIIAGERSVDPWKSRYHYLVDRFLLRYTTAIATNTSAVVEFYRSKGIKAVFHVIPNAVMPSKTKPISREELCRRLGIPQRGKIIGSIGRLWPQKGYADLIWASELVRVAYQDCWYVIVGDGPELQRLQRLRDKYGAEDVAIFAGHRSDAAELISGLDMLWNGSLYEGQSNTILEAMVNAKPVIASDIPGNRDLVASGQSGYLWQLGQTGELARLTNRVLHDGAHAQDLGSAARRRAEEHFSLSQMVRRYEELYLTLSASA